jgi:hypothetical protein
VRELADADRITRFLRALGRAADADSACYLTGGATAVFYGWRATTIDVDVKLVPESDALLRAIQGLKNELRINVELASPADFIPVPDGWEERGVFVAREGRLSVYHFDLVAQALAKLERSHPQDLEDVRELLARGLVGPDEALAYFARVEPELHRFPAIDTAGFKARVEATFRSPLR